MWKPICVILGAMIAALAAIGTCCSVVFVRFEEAYALDEMVTQDVVIGGMFAVAIILLSAPWMVARSVKRYVVVAFVSISIWSLVSWLLIRHHEKLFEENLRFHSAAIANGTRAD